MPGPIRDRIRLKDSIRAGGEAPVTPAQAASAPQPPNPEPPAQDPPPVNPPAQDPPPPAPPQQPDLTAEVSRLTQAFETLKGKYNSELGPLQTQLRAAHAEIERLKKEQEKKLTPPPEPATTLTADEIRDVGPDLVEVIGKKAREIADGLVSAKMAELQDKIDALGGMVDNIGKEAKTTARDRFERYMDTNVANWRTQDINPEFIGWLQEEDAFSGVQRLAILRTAMAQEQFARVKTIFEGYVAEKAAVAQAGKDKRPALDTLAAPNGNRGRTAAINPDNAPVAPTGDEVRAFYRKLANPNHGMPEAEVKAFKSRIHAAVAAGKLMTQPRI
jgi:hypothetical protein